MLDELELGGQKRCLPLVCLHGQLKLASWTLLDGLVNSGGNLYYSGDFDPEGLQIAERLLIRYAEKVKLWLRRFNVREWLPTKKGY